MHVIDYAQVLQQAAAVGLRCVYPNSGAFVPAGEHRIVGWIGPDDSTIRSDLPAAIVRCPAPYPQTLATWFNETWQREFPQTIWVLPKSHWAYELEHAHQPWLFETLTGFGIDAARLARHTDAAAIAFEPDEAADASRLLISLLTHLKTSDYAILVPGKPVVATVHHHQQLWWQLSGVSLAERLGDR